MGNKKVKLVSRHCRKVLERPCCVFYYLQIKPVLQHTRLTVTGFKKKNVYFIFPFFKLEIKFTLLILL